jgi:hypothetical protein
MLGIATSMRLASSNRKAIGLARPKTIDIEPPKAIEGEALMIKSETAPAKGNPAAAPVPSALPTAAPGHTATIRYIDRLDVGETFADCVTGLMFDGQTLRIEFGVTRFDELKANVPVSGRRYPACRIVLPPAAAVDLINRMQQIATALAQAGVVKAGPRPAEAAKAD